MPTLHLGVVVQPYDNRTPAARATKAGTAAHVKARTGTEPTQVTTGDVATWLEHKYHVMEHFFERHKADIEAPLVQSVKRAVDAILAGAPSRLDPFGSGLGAIEESFRMMLDRRELDMLGYPGIPTAAAQAGVDHRKAHPYAKRKARPSFIDSGLYQASFKAWID